jgi:transcriptional regulator GlxA family with amidase domain
MPPAYSPADATTHFASLERLRALGDVDVVEERFVRDENVWSSAGVSAGIDLTLAFIAAVAGDESAGKVQLYAEYYPSGVKYGGAEARARTPRYVGGS